jgi:hypothetical protein
MDNQASGNVHVVSGTITSNYEITNDGTITIDAGGEIDNSMYQLTNGGTLSVSGSFKTYSITNNGEITLAGDDGSIVNFGGLSNQASANVHVVSGTITCNDEITNDGTITIDAGGEIDNYMYQLNNGGTGTLSVSGSFKTYSIANSGEITLTGVDGSIANFGGLANYASANVYVVLGSKITNNGDITNGGTITVDTDGEIDNSGYQLTNGGTLSVAGIINNVWGMDNLASGIVHVVSCTITINY